MASGGASRLGDIEMDAQPVGRPRRDRLRLRPGQRADRDDRPAGDRRPGRRAAPGARNLGLGLQIPIGEHGAFLIEGRGFYFPKRTVEWAPVVDRPLSDIEQLLLTAAAGAAPTRRVRAVVGAGHDRLRRPLLTRCAPGPEARSPRSWPRRRCCCRPCRPRRRATLRRRCRPRPGKDAPGLPPLPEVSPRNASYTIEARLDPDAHRITGVLVLDWRNTSAQALSSFPFHLYWNAFRNNLSTTARGEGRRAPDDAKRDDRSFGWIEVKSIRLLGEPDEDLLPTLRYLNEDGNTDDRTVMEVRTARADRAGRERALPDRVAVARPHGTVGRAGWVHDYNFIVQWFPKIGVFWKGQWNCHPFYPWTEFFSDYGVYDVKLTLPSGFVVGATGRQESKTDNPDGTDDLPLRPGGRPRLRLDGEPPLPRAARALRGARATRPSTSGCCCSPSTRTSPSATSRPRRSRCGPTAPGRRPIPTRRSPSSTRRWSSASGGMEYPTLFTGGASCLSPRRSCRAPRASRSTRPATSSGTGSWRTTSSRRRGSTRASTPT